MGGVDEREGFALYYKQRLSEAISETTGRIESITLVRSYNLISFIIEFFEPLETL